MTENKILQLHPSKRINFWEARQMILAELYEFKDAMRSDHYRNSLKPFYEANDVFGYINYLGIDLFIEAVKYIRSRSAAAIIEMAAAHLLLSKPSIGYHIPPGKDTDNYNEFLKYKDQLYEMFFKDVKTTFEAYVN